jgi:hypothetical protein
MLTTNQKGMLIIAGAATFLPIFRSGLRDNLNLWEWLWNHTIWGPKVEYIPEEQYESAICITRRAGK